MVGGMIANFIDALHRDDQVRIIACHHEQGAGFAAEGHARMNGIPGVAMGTSGPGAINLLTALGSCHFDSTPAVFITGQVNRSEQKRDRPIRQLGFQETDVVAMAAPIAKAAMRVETVEDLPKRLTEAFALARAGRPGPVLVDIPLDLQRAELDAPLPDSPEAIDEPRDSRVPDDVAIARIIDDLARAERPLILAGGGLRSGRAVDGFREFVDRLGVPVVHSLMGVDALPFEHPLRVGMIGTYGNRWANIALSRCDAMLVLGSRLDIRQTGADTAAFATGRTIHHVDCDPGEVNNRVTGCHAVIAELSTAIAALAQAADEVPRELHESWCEEISELAQTWPDTGELAGIEGDQSQSAYASALGRAGGGGLCSRRWPTPDVGSPIARAERPSAVSHLRWHGRDGLRPADGRGGGGGGWWSDCADRRRWWFSAKYPRAADRRSQRSPNQDGDSRQRLPWHGSSVPGVVFRPPLPIHLVGILGAAICRGSRRLRDSRTTGGGASRRRECTQGDVGNRRSIISRGCDRHKRQRLSQDSLRTPDQ